jgi:SAM-dependent methyltransferase
MINDLKNHYRSLYQKNGDTPQAVQHISKAGQFRRFEILTSLVSKEDSVADVGCGLGEMLNFLRENGYTGRYLGLDFLPEFIATANIKFKNYSDAEFIEFNVNQDDLPKGYDFILMSGIFNNRIVKNHEFLFDSITKLFKKCKRGLVFNSLSTYVEYQEEHLYYSDPLFVFDFCKKNITPFVKLKHDYLSKPDGFPYEYTMFLSKDVTF